MILRTLIFSLSLFTPIDSFSADLVSVKNVPGSQAIIEDLRYATTNNFLGNVIYKDPTCYLRPEVAAALVQSQKHLPAHTHYKVWDCYRSLTAQKRLYDKCLELEKEGKLGIHCKGNVAPPNKTANHPRGCAIDLTLSDDQGKDLVMPTLFDDFTGKAKPPANEKKAGGKVPFKNFMTLRSALMKSGFQPIASEWWHYQWNCERYPQASKQN